jgi:RimJ/RimL family protein N-acetyltransferase
VLKHLSTLKYLSIYRAHATVRVAEEGKDWAVLAVFPTGILSYDTATYPRAGKAVFVNGTNNKLKYTLLDTLTPENYLVRLNENLDLSRYTGRFVLSAGHAFISFTIFSPEKARNNESIQAESQLTPEAIAIFGRNGYTPDDLAGYFEHGARWFGKIGEGHIASACFVFQNYIDIWEIAGVHTLEPERRHGYAAVVVRSALDFLLNQGLTLRYEAEHKNLASIELAHRLGMKEFLTIRHYLMEMR